MSQRLVVGGVEYDLFEAIQEASIRDLILLKKDGGVSVKSIVEAFNALSESADPLDVFDSVDALEAFAGLVFLCKRKAKENVSFEDAASVSFASVKFGDDEDEEEADDPKVSSTPDSVEAG